MELRPGWKTRWIAISVLALPTIVFFVYSLRHPAVNAKGKAAVVQAGKPDVPAQTASPWVMQDSGTTAGLRGIDSVDGKIAWASGTGGTVLRTLDGGEHWTKCAVPGPDGETLDFRGVQAWDANSAIVMASGPGDKSRLYKTIDGCKSWKLILKNEDKDGFWDAFLINRFDKDGELLGDPVNGAFVILETEDGGQTWQTRPHEGLKSLAQEGAFAASNSALFLEERYGTGFVTGGPQGARIFLDEDEAEVGKFVVKSLPVAGGSAGAGGFSIEARDWCCRVVVGGDYTKPNESSGTAAWTSDGGLHWTGSKKPPHGYRSSVQWSEDLNAWITVGTNGSDISRDDGKTWQPLDDGNWNALSMPFVVGPKGRIARLKIPLAP